jgi:methylated-DNA-[protein]-cysteine S-methyltransferase
VIRAATLLTPLGPFSVLDDDGVRAAGFTDDPGSLRHELAPPWRTAAVHHDDLSEYTGAVRAYFDGDLHALDSVPVIQPGDGFRARAWREMRRVTVGSTISYRELATLAGNPRAARAAGAACAANLAPLFVPCHRIVGSDGGLNHYYYGLGHKRWLLDHESAAR